MCHTDSLINKIKFAAHFGNKYVLFQCREITKWCIQPVRYDIMLVVMCSHSQSRH